MYREIEELLKESKKGDMKSKEKLLLKLNPLIISSIRRYYNRTELYDDLIQEGYEVVLKCLEDYDPSKGTKFLGYVKTMLKYKYLDKHKEKYCLSLNEPVGDGKEEILDLLEGDEKEPIENIISSEENKLLLGGLKKLTERQREVIVHYYIESKTIKEISEILGVSYRTVVNTKTNSLKKLKKIMVKR